MIKYLPTLTLMATLLCAAVPSHATSRETMTEEQTKILHTIETMTAAFHAGDLNGVMESYEPEAAIAFEPGSAVSDRALLEQGFQSFFSLQPNFTYSGHEIIVTDDIAVHFAPWKMTGTTPDGQSIAQSGLSVAVLRKQENGEWLMVIDNPHGQHLMGQ